MNTQVLKMPKPNHNRHTNQKQNYHNIVNYDDKPYGFHPMGYEELLEVNGKTFPEFKFTATDGREYTVEDHMDSPWQRDTHGRVRSNTGPNGHFNDLNVMSRYVDCTLYIGPKTTIEDEHEIYPNTLVYNDAHARRLASKLHIGRSPYNQKCVLNVPETWILNITITDDIDDLRTNYDCNDNKRASKSKRDEVQSVLRALNYLPSLKSEFIKQGRFASSIETAVPVKKSSPNVLQGLDLLDQIKMIKDPLDMVDKKLSSVQRQDPDVPNVLLQHQVLGIVLQFAQKKAYGNDPKLQTVIERLIQNQEENTKQDGISVLCNLFGGNSKNYKTLETQIGGLYLSFKAKLNNKPNSISNLLPLDKGMNYYERKEGPNLVVYLINHYLETNGATVDLNNINWKRDIKDKYQNLVSYAYNGGTSI